MLWAPPVGGPRSSAARHDWAAAGGPAGPRLSTRAGGKKVGHLQPVLLRAKSQKEKEEEKKWFFFYFKQLFELNSHKLDFKRPATHRASKKKCSSMNATLTLHGFYLIFDFRILLWIIIICLIK